MAKFCGKCGAKLDADASFCAECGTLTGNTITNVQEPAITNDSNAKVSRKTKFKKKQKEKPKKKKLLLFKIISILLALLIASGGIIGVLTYFDFIDIPFVSSAMDFFGITGEKESSDESQSAILDYKFTEISIIDEASAIAAAQDAAGLLGLYNAADELTVKNTNTLDGSTYYRLQQNYMGLPVYGRTFVVVADENGNAQGLTSNAVDVKNLSVNPTAQTNDIITAIKNHLSENLDINVDVSIPNISDKNLTVYIDTALRPHLAYIIIAANHEFIVDANNAKVLNCFSLILTEAVLTKAGDNNNHERQFYTWKENETEYILRDSNRNITIFNANNDELQRQFKDADGNIVAAETRADFANVASVEFFTNNSGVLSALSSNNNIWNNRKSVTLIYNLTKTYDYYNSFFGRAGTNGQSNRIAGFYDDSMPWAGAGNAYCGGYALFWQNEVMLSFGTNNSISLDTVAHEYTHGVERSESGMNYQGESGAIMEAYSDIFGELVEGYEASADPDWEHGNRIIHNPLSKKYPEKYKGKHWKKTDVKTPTLENDYGGVHTNNTVLSYAAFLMQNGVDNKYTALSLNELSSLWYKTMLTLPSNCTFSFLRDSMEVTAERLGFSAAQQECIEAAFDKVEIKGQDKDEGTYSTNTKISVRDKNNDVYDNYTIKIEGTKNKAFWGLINEEYEKEIIVNNERDRDIDVPKGTYTITITDNFNKNKSVSKTIKARKNNKNDKLRFVTNFGFDYTLSASAELTVYDKNNLIYGDYDIRINGTKNESSNKSVSYSDSISVDRAESIPLNLSAGNYSIMLIDRHDTKKTKVFTVRINDSSNEADLKIKTDFGKGTGEFDKAKLPPGAVEYNGHYYYIYNTENNLSMINSWEDARDFCFEREGYLATISDEDENDFIYSLLTDFGLTGNKASAYFGLYDFGGYNDDWRWITDEKLDYTNWADGEPSSYSERYGMFFYRSKGKPTWNDGDFGVWTQEGEKAFICEWGEYKPEIADADAPPSQRRTTSDERDIVLVLDASGSMSGTPIAETKKASNKFIDRILQEDASIGIVTYESSATIASDFSINQGHLKSVVDSISSSGGTNTDEGLQSAYEMLQYSNAKKKIIVLMSDGEPNTGRVGQALIDFATEIKKDDIYIYTLGFFSSLSGDSKISAQTLMGSIASEGCHYEVDDADELVSFFGDIADQIKGTKYIYVHVACPVDVSVSHNGETLSSAENNLNTRTAFGSLTFEENKANEEHKIKILRLKEDAKYDIQIVGKARGKMDYTIGFMDEDGKYSDFRRFKGIDITRTTVIDTVAKPSGDTVLNIDENGDGKYDLKYKAGTNEFGMLVDNTYIYYIIFSSVAAFAVLVFVLSLRRRIKTKKNKTQ